MSAVQDDEEQRTSDESAGRKSTRRGRATGAAKKAAPKRTRAKRTKKPPAKVEPSWVHTSIAGAILKGFQDAAIKTPDGAPAIDVGKVPDELLDIVPGEGGEETEGPEPIDILARVIAHIFHRTPGMKRLETKLEGQELRSGMFADVGALIAVLFRKNKPLIVAAFKAAQHERAEAKAAAPVVAPATTAPKGEEGR
jgi:hypothetical protein